MTIPEDDFTRITAPNKSGEWQELPTENLGCLPPIPYGMQVYRVLKEMRAVIERVTDEERITIINTMMDGYCKECGVKLNGPCYCNWEPDWD